MNSVPSDPNSPVTRRTEPNALGSETSPYLLQHAFNPVDWYPWNASALALAKQLDKPVFLSIGYSACHWCHVMEHESFENASIAKQMNDDFICIKVDREERPDLDQIYMTAVQMLTGRGGWPMSVFLTPDLRPFYGGTYWPPTSRMGMPGFRDILIAVADAWKNRHDDVLRSADELTSEVMRAANESLPPSPLGVETMRSAMTQLLQRVDWRHGGLGGAPKFPHPMDLRVLLRCWQRFKEPQALEAVRLTLDKMASGGIYDHLGGGFHRYSTDAVWLAPHFEKMLYDNALLTQAYLEAFQATGDQCYARVARETLDYVLREMTQAGGGFYSTQDADTEGEEGKFFVWTEAEVLELLGPEDGRLFCAAYDVTARGNWEGHNILNRSNVRQVSNRRIHNEQVVNQPDELETVLSGCRAKLFAERAKRVAPARDEKVLVNWNGLMIAAMSQAASIFSEPRYSDAARQAADFILLKLRDSNGRLLHCFKNNQARFSANLDDYACLIDGLVDLYHATFESEYLDSAIDLANQMLSHFQDSSSAALFFTSTDRDQLIARVKDTQDNATPSGNGMASHALARLGTLVSQSGFREKSEAILDAISGQLEKAAIVSGQSLLALDFVLGPTHEIVFSSTSEPNTFAEDRSAITRLFQNFWPNKVVAHCPSDANLETLPKMLRQLASGKSGFPGDFAVFVCEQGHCQNPIVGKESWGQFLETRFGR